MAASVARTLHSCRLWLETRVSTEELARPRQSVWRLWCPESNGEGSVPPKSQGSLPGRSGCHLSPSRTGPRAARSPGRFTRHREQRYPARNTTPHMTSATSAEEEGEHPGAPAGRSQPCWAQECFTWSLSQCTKWRNLPYLLRTADAKLCFTHKHL